MVSGDDCFPPDLFPVGHRPARSQGVDILADASDTLGQISGSIASITGDQHFLMRSASRRMVEETSIGGALLHGGEAMAAGLFRGITGARRSGVVRGLLLRHCACCAPVSPLACGLTWSGCCAGMVTKPLEGAKEKGVTGFVSGIGKGMAGLVLQPVSGAVDLASKTVEGVNKSKVPMWWWRPLLLGTSLPCHHTSFAHLCRPRSTHWMILQAHVVDFIVSGEAGVRRRPPMAIGAEGVIRSYNSKAAEGQHILRTAEWRAVGSAGGLVDRLDLFKTRSRCGKQRARK